MANLSAIAFVLVSLLAEIAVLIIIAVAGRGRARRTGLIGAAVLMIGAVLSALVTVLAPMLIQQFDLPLTFYSLVFIPVAILHSIGLIMLAVAVGTHWRESAGASASPAYPPAPRPY